MGGHVQTRLFAGRYRLEELLGGTDTEVYRAVDEQLGRPVVVKMARSAAPGYKPERFGNEMRTLAGVRHPGLVTLYDAGTQDAVPYLVMQYVPGTSLAGRLRCGRPPVEEIRRIGAVLADALAYLHARGVVHRDVKPGNVLLGEHAEICLADLGIARAADTAGLTATGHVVGTPAYLAPEQVAGLPVGPACDLYALGLVLLECFTGRREYTGNPVEAALARLSRPPVIPAELPGPWRRLLADLTASDPGERPDAGRVAALLAGPFAALPADAALAADVASALPATAAAATAPEDGDRTRPDLRLPLLVRRWKAAALMAAGAALGAASIATAWHAVDASQTVPTVAGVAKAVQPAAPGGSAAPNDTTATAAALSAVLTPTAAPSRQPQQQVSGTGQKADRPAGDHRGPERGGKGGGHKGNSGKAGRG